MPAILDASSQPEVYFWSDSQSATPWQQGQAIAPGAPWTGTVWVSAVPDSALTGVFTIDFDADSAPGAKGEAGAKGRQGVTELYVHVKAVGWTFGQFTPTQQFIQQEFDSDVKEANATLKVANVQVIESPGVTMINLTAENAKAIGVFNGGSYINSVPIACFDATNRKANEMARAKAGVANSVVIASYVQYIDGGAMGWATLPLNTWNMFYLAPKAGCGGARYPWVFAHELCHELGLPHEESWTEVSNLMVGGYLPDPPDVPSFKAAWEAIAAKMAPGPARDAAWSKFVYEHTAGARDLTAKQIAKLRASPLLSSSK